MPLDVDRIRARFPALTRSLNDQPVVFLDGPAGSQVPQEVADAVSRYLLSTNANTHGPFATSVESDRILGDARAAVAAFLNAGDPREVVFGPNMTTLTFALSRSLARTWNPGDEVVVTQLDHDANVTPWVLAARDAGATVRTAGVRVEDATLDLDAFDAVLSERTRLVAFGAASNSVGTLNPIAELTRRAHAAGAEVFVDAVHYAPHALTDVAAWGCDYLACSAYKFFGPHVGILWGRHDRLRALPAYQVRPAGDDMPDRFSIGTQSHEGIAGTLAAIEYLGGLGGGGAHRPALERAFAAITLHERGLLARLLRGLAEQPEYRVWGLADPGRLAERVPTVSITHERISPNALAAALAARGIFVWSGNYYAVELSQALGREPHGMVRIGLLHYNTAAEIDRLLAALRSIADGGERASSSR
ncbi:MAG TPA: cysteine desulfurase-like protein [Kofleriaceae bacterium]|nr:cysteine desulfurase-like protein [Kofleriaceae bacterium]